MSAGHTQTVVCDAQLVEGLPDGAVEGLLRGARDAEYAAMPPNWCSAHVNDRRLLMRPQVVDAAHATVRSWPRGSDG